MMDIDACRLFGRITTLFLPPSMFSASYTFTSMTIEDYIELLDILEAHPGPVLLSGYAHQVYDYRLKHWRRETLNVAAEAGAKRQEVFWINPVAAEFGTK